MGLIRKMIASIWQEQNKEAYWGNLDKCVKYNEVTNCTHRTKNII